MHKMISFDGGGVFGVAQAAIIQGISDLTKYSAVAGTSIGAVNAAVIATRDTGMQARLPRFFDEWMPEIFSGYWWRRLSPMTPKYPDWQLNKALQSLFPTQYFRDVKIPTFITAIDLNARRLKVFNSTDAQDGSIPLWEVLRMATAAESYFTPYQGKADGGISANNPSMVLVAAAQSTLGIDSSNIELLSVGAGEMTYNSDVGAAGYSTLLGWGEYVLQSALSGSSSRMHEYFVQQMGLKRYERIQFMRECGWDMDNPDIMAVVLNKWKPAIDAGIVVANSF